MYYYLYGCLKKSFDRNLSHLKHSTSPNSSEKAQVTLRACTECVAAWEKGVESLENTPDEQ